MFGILNGRERRGVKYVNDFILRAVVLDGGGGGKKGFGDSVGLCLREEG